MSYLQAITLCCQDKYIWWMNEISYTVSHVLIYLTSISWYRNITGCFFTKRKNQQMFCLRKIKSVFCIVSLLSSKSLMTSICIILKSIYIHHHGNIYFILLTADLNESNIHICHESNVTMQKEIFNILWCYCFIFSCKNLNGFLGYSKMQTSHK